MALRLGPCSAWVGQADIEKVGSIPDDIAPARVAELADVATEILFYLSGRRYAGECVATVRPSRRVMGDRRRPSSWGTLGWYSGWGYCNGPLNLNEPNLGLMCGCDPIRSVTLGAYPVTAITEVLIDGVVLSPSAYRLDGGRELVRTDGHTWPLHQDMNLNPPAVGTFTVEFTYGSGPGPAGVYACAEYARQLCLRESQDGKCTLPERVQSIRRQGVDMVLLDPLDFIDNGRTGVPAVDSWLKAITRPAPRSGVYSPDHMPTARPVDA